MLPIVGHESDAGQPLGDATPGRSPEPGRADWQEARRPPGQATNGGHPPGLVICAITGREFEAASAWQPRFPTPQLVAAAAAMYAGLPAWDGEEGPRARLVIGPGLVQLTRRDMAKRERSTERLQARRADLDYAGQYLAEHGQLPDPPPGRSQVTAWSARSHARMWATLAALDWTPLFAGGRIPAMTTLTLPDQWQVVAPTGPAYKRLVATFRRRYSHAWGEPLRGAWKQEYQPRARQAANHQAPHTHLFHTPPLGLAGQHRDGTQRPGVGDGLPYRQWLSVTWADVVNHPDPEQRRRHQLAGTGVDYAQGLRATDPRRVAAYFAKHGSYGAKWRQNVPPPEWQARGAGPGRYWGVWGLDKATAAVELAPHDAITAARTLRRYAAAQGAKPPPGQGPDQPGVRRPVTRQVRVPRQPGGRVESAYPVVQGLAGAQWLAAHPVKRRTLRRRAKRLKHGAGFVCVNDAPALAAQLARYLDRGSARPLTATARKPVLNTAPQLPAAP